MKTLRHTDRKYGSFSFHFSTDTKFNATDNMQNRNTIMTYDLAFTKSLNQTKPKDHKTEPALMKN